MQQLHKNGSISSELPPWSASEVHVAGSETTTNEVREVEGSQENDVMYSNVEDVRTLASTCTSSQEILQPHADHSAHPEHTGENLAAKESDVKENDYETVVLKPQPSRPAPPRPVPYSVSRKLSDKSGSHVDKKLMEKVFIIIIFFC